MAKFSPTPDQKKAIEAPIMDLLVSAAAGSGKTAVLSQRILRLILSHEENTELSRMLVVTFTKAAAEELRARIGRALREKLKELRSDSTAPDAFWQEERVLLALDQLESAEVSTIHSFCFHLIKRHFADLNLSASLRIGEEAECKLLERRVMEETIEEMYESAPEEAAVFEKMTDYRDTGLEDILLGFYAKFSSLPRGIATMQDTLDQLEEAQASFENTVYAKAILKKLDSFFSYYKLVLTTAVENLKTDAKAVDKYLPAFWDDLQFVEGWDKLKEQEYSLIAGSILAFSPSPLGRYTGTKPECVEDAAALRKEFTADLAAIKGIYFSFTSDDIVKDAAEMHAILSVVYRVLTRFEKGYAEAKSRYGILDYNDLERNARKLLVDQNGNPTPLAKSVAKRYDAIFIDEYQDTNEMQDSIFSAISRYNRFMVGDIKQSIYGFRGAVPEIFSSYRTQFAPYDEKSANQKQATIFLSHNFRSDRGVIEYTNDVFYQLFNHNSGSVPYMEGDALVCAREEKDDLKLSTRYLMVDRSQLNENGNPLTEYEVVAHEILRLVTSGVKPSEIVILLRSMTKADAYRQALTDLSLPCVSDKGGDFLPDYPEVLLLIALLNVIDNPTRDVYLAASLKSPLFGFTLSELITLRKKAPDASLYASLIRFVSLEENDQPILCEKVKCFLQFLEKARRFAELKSSDKVIRYLLQTTPLSAVAVKQKQKNAPLSAFYEFARRYESGGFGGVHGLVQHVKEISASDNKEALLYHRSVDLSAVQIMSVHHSKGCEYDYVFLADCSHLFNKNDETADIVYESGMGIAMKLRSENGFLRYDTIFRRAIASKIHENSIDEDMRVLYVALTRAKRQIILVAGLNGPKQKKVETFLQYSLRHAVFQHSYLYSQANTYAEWLSLALSKMTFDLVDSLDRYTDEAKGDVLPHAEHTEEQVPLSLLQERLCFLYPHEALQKLPTKLSVSRLYPGILDDEAEELIRSEKAEFDRLPLFMQDQNTISGSERGTATHLFMQFCDFDKVAQQGVIPEIRRLVEQAFITEGIASLIETKKLESFFTSELFARIQKAKAVYREERFHVRLPASDFTLDDNKSEAYASEYILVQGVVDCLIQEADGSLLLIDYKTDRTPKDRAEAEAMLRERYTTQLSYYKKAVETVFGVPVKQTLLYAFSLNDTVEIQ